MLSPRAVEPTIDPPATHWETEIRTRPTAVLLALLLPLAAVTGCASSDDGESDDGVFDDTSVSVDAPVDRSRSRTERKDPRDPRSPSYEGPRYEAPGDDEPVDEGPVQPL